MNKNVLLIIAMIACAPLGAVAQKWGAGFRLGDPSGLSVKHYGGKNAIELSIGRTNFFSRYNYYNHEYDRWYDRRAFGYKEHQFLGYGSSIPIGIQLHILRHKNIKGAEGLDWYYGYGAQVRTRRYSWDYRYKLQNSNEWVVVRGEQVRATDFGLDGVLGLEYKFKDAPISIFLDATLYMEIINDPFVFWGQGGIGARFRF